MRAMKALVLALVLANVAYFLWSRRSGPAIETTTPVAAPRLRLASEAASALPGATASQASAAVAAAPPVQPAPAAALPPVASVAASTPTDGSRCLSIGPFLDVAETARAAATLRGAGYQPRQRVAEGEVWAGVWVYVALPSSPTARAHLRARLEAAGIDDALEMPGPRGAPVMSLGLFSESQGAETRVRLARSLGLQPATADRKRTGEVYWIDVDLKSSDPNLTPANFDEDGSRIVRLQITECPRT
ncbi:MAG: hypothetical protein KGL34_08965 [Gammaproteobacteria bacterium]|nr:hypothetical protein [Gammaproteobacteria bacterium]